MSRAQSLLTTPLLVLALASLLVAAVAPPPSTADNIERLVQQLGSDNFKERKEAAKALYKIGVPALAALRRAQATSKDLETQRRAIDLINAIEARMTPDAFVPTKVRIKADKTPLGEVLRSLSKQSGIALHLAREPADLIRRPITLDTGTLSFWEALDTLCREAKIHIRPEIREVNPSNIAAAPQGQPLAPAVAPALPMVPALPQPAPAVPPVLPAAPAMPIAPPALPAAPPAPPAIPAAPAARAVAVWMAPAMEAPSESYQLVLQDGLLPETPISYLGSVRLRLVFTSRDGGEVRGYVEALSEPRREWSGGLSVRWSEGKDAQGKALASLPLSKEVSSGPQGGGRGVRNFGGGLARILFGNAGNEEQSFGPVNRQEIPVVWQVPGKDLNTVSELRGEFSGKTELPAQPVVTVADMLKVAPQPLAGKSGYEMTVQECKWNNNDGSVKVRLTVSAPAQKNAPAGGIQGGIQIQIQGNGPGGGIAMIAGDDDGMFQFNAKDTKGRPYTILIEQFDTEPNNKKNLHKYTLNLQPAAKDAVPGKLELLAPVEATVKSSFTFRNLRLP